MTSYGECIRWGWAWVRGPNASGEWASFSDLLALLRVFKPNGGSDRWGWANEEGTGFSVKALRVEIASSGQPAGNVAALVWNLWAPPKSS
ncbi:hypothetical protein Hanom_Chr11g00999051 [Helianthus anomalus]